MGVKPAPKPSLDRWGCACEISSLPFGSKNSLQVASKSTGSKTSDALIYCGSKVCLGRVGSGSISTELEVRQKG